MPFILPTQGTILVTYLKGIFAEAKKNVFNDENETKFGNINKMGISNLEERWIEGVNSFATYFPSSSKAKEAKSKGYQYTNQKGEFFDSDINDKDNIEKSKTKLIASCNEYFGSECNSITDCQEKLHSFLGVFPFFFNDIIQVNFMTGNQINSWSFQLVKNRQANFASYFLKIIK